MGGRPPRRVRRRGSRIHRIVPRAIALSVVMWLAQAALLFGSAGRFDWPMAWALLCAIVVVAVCGFAALDPELIAERSKPTPGFDRSDAVLASISGLALIFIPLQVAGIDVGRLQVPHFPIEVRIAALGIFLLGNLFSIWAAHCNRFFSDFVRIQHERGHHVVSNGPYAHLRHPGYAGGIAAYLAVPVALGSAWTLLPALVGAALLVARAAREDRMLHAKSPPTAPTPRACATGSFRASGSCRRRGHARHGAAECLPCSPSAARRGIIAAAAPSACIETTPLSAPWSRW